MRNLLSFLLLLFLTCSPAWAGVSFDGTDDKMTFGTTNLPNGSQAVTVFSIFELNDTTGGGVTVSAWTNDGNTGQNWLQYFADEATDRIRFGKRTSAGGGYYYVQYSGTISANTVYKAVQGINADASSGISNVNGTENTTVTFWYGAGVNNTLYPWIGATRDSGGGSSFFDGKIYTICIWNTLLTSAQANTLVTAQTKNICEQVAPSNLVRSFYLDDQPDGTSGDADAYRDRSSNSDTATGDDGANNTGLTNYAEKVSSYP
mgnify:CR=1 FL=1